MCPICPQQNIPSVAEKDRGEQHLTEHQQPLRRSRCACTTTQVLEDKVVAKQKSWYPGALPILLQIRIIRSCRASSMGYGKSIRLLHRPRPPDCTSCTGDSDWQSSIQRCPKVGRHQQSGYRSSAASQRWRLQQNLELPWPESGPGVMYQLQQRLHLSRDSRRQTLPRGHGLPSTGISDTMSGRMLDGQVMVIHTIGLLPPSF